MKLHKAGRPIPRADLPDPPGFAPIPVSDTPQVTAAPGGAAASAGAAALEQASVGSVATAEASSVSHLFRLEHLALRLGTLQEKSVKTASGNFSSGDFY